jgi:hypothetical protein
MWMVTRTELKKNPILGFKLLKALPNTKALFAPKSKIPHLPKDFVDQVNENSRDLDKHMIWIAGGVLSVLVLLYDQDSVANFGELSLRFLHISFVLFCVCLWCVISSFFTINRSFIAIKLLQNQSYLFAQDLKEINALSEKEQDEIANSPKKRGDLRLKLELSWNAMRYYLLLVVLIPKVTDAMNIASYLCFSFGLITLICFGITLYR